MDDKNNLSVVPVSLGMAMVPISPAPIDADNDQPNKKEKGPANIAYRIFSLVFFLLGVGGLFLGILGDMTGGFLAHSQHVALSHETAILNGSLVGIIVDDVLNIMNIVMGIIEHGLDIYSLLESAVAIISILLLAFLVINLVIAFFFAIIGLCSRKAARNCMHGAAICVLLGYSAIVLHTLCQGYDSLGFVELFTQHIDKPSLILVGVSALSLMITTVIERKGMGFFNVLLFLCSFGSIVVFTLPNNFADFVLLSTNPDNLTMETLFGFDACIAATVVLAFNFIFSCSRICAKRGYGFDIARALLQVAGLVVMVVAAMLSPMGVNLFEANETFLLTVIILVLTGLFFLLSIVATILNVHIRKKAKAAEEEEDDIDDEEEDVPMVKRPQPQPQPVTATPAGAYPRPGSSMPPQGSATPFPQRNPNMPQGGPTPYGQRPMPGQQTGNPNMQNPYAQRPMPGQQAGGPQTPPRPMPGQQPGGPQTPPRPMPGQQPGGPQTPPRPMPGQQPGGPQTPPRPMPNQQAGAQSGQNPNAPYGQRPSPMNPITARNTQNGQNPLGYNPQNATPYGQQRPMPGQQTSGGPQTPPRPTPTSQPASGPQTPPRPTPTPQPAAQPQTPPRPAPAPQPAPAPAPAPQPAPPPPMTEFEKAMAAIVNGTAPTSSAAPATNGYAAPSINASPLNPSARPAANPTPTPQPPKEEEPMLSKYASQTFDQFASTLTAKELNEFGDLFIANKYGVLSYMPAYELGGDNKEFFSKIFIYLGRFRENISDGLLSKLYKFVCG